MFVVFIAMKWNEMELYYMNGVCMCVFIQVCCSDLELEGWCCLIKSEWETVVGGSIAINSTIIYTLGINIIFCIHVPPLGWQLIVNGDASSIFVANRLRWAREREIKWKKFPTVPRLEWTPDWVSSENTRTHEEGRNQHPNTENRQCCIANIADMKSSRVNYTEYQMKKNIHITKKVAAKCEGVQGTSSESRKMTYTLNFLFMCMCVCVC